MTFSVLYAAECHLFYTGIAAETIVLIFVSKSDIINTDIC